MRKLSVLALVVILAGALSVVGYGIDDSSSSVSVNAGINNTISITVVEGQNVNFGSGLDPMKEHFEMKATKLEVTSTVGKSNWTVTHNVTGSASEVLTIGYGDIGGSTQNFGGLRSQATGSNGTHTRWVNYKLSGLKTLGQNNISAEVTFTVSA